MKLPYLRIYKVSRKSFHFITYSLIVSFELSQCLYSQHSFFHFASDSSESMKMEMYNYIIFVVLFIYLLGETEGSYFSRSMDWMTEKVGYSGCKWYDCCDKKWTHSDFQDLHDLLKREVYGQNIALDVILPALQGHLLPDKPKSKALVISFHGRPGIGKNYVADKIKNNLFNKHGETKHVHFFSGRNHFPLQAEVDNYKKNLHNWIKGNVSECEYSLFIFDEVDKMPPGVLDALVSYIDYNEKIDGIDFRKTTFIFLSNTGGDLIAKKYLEYWKAGKKRENLRLADFEDLIMRGAFNEKGGFQRSDTIESSLIDHYVPFLPLEEEHVRKCILDQFKLRSKGSFFSKFSDEIINDITFGPDDHPIFSNGGCKRISSKVSQITERIYFRRSDL